MHNHDRLFLPTIDLLSFYQKDCISSCNTPFLVLTIIGAGRMCSLPELLTAPPQAKSNGIQAFRRRLLDITVPRATSDVGTVQHEGHPQRGAQTCL